jgi:hypothetical protein
MRKSENGFAAVEGLLIAIVVLLVGFIGYYVWHTNHKPDSKPAVTSSNSTPAQTTEKEDTKTTPTAPVDSTTYLTVSEWDVKVPLSAGTTGLSYIIRKTTQTEGSIASFSSNDLRAASTAGCTSNTIEVARGNKNQFVPQEAGTSTTSYEAQYNQTKTNDSYYIGVKIGDNYLVSPNYRGASCSGSSESQAKADVATEAILAAIRKAVAK